MIFLLFIIHVHMYVKLKSDCFYFLAIRLNFLPLVEGGGGLS